MRWLSAIFDRNRIRIEQPVLQGLEILIALADLLKESERNATPGSAEAMEKTVKLEGELESRYTVFLENLDHGSSLPFYWQDLFELYSSCKRLMELLSSFAARRRIFPSARSFESFFALQRSLLENQHTFLQEYLANRKYGRELLRNNEHLLKDLSENILRLLHALDREGNGSLSLLQLTSGLEQIVEIDRAVQARLQKIFLETNL